MPSREKSPEDGDLAEDMMIALIEEMGARDFAKAFMERLDQNEQVRCGLHFPILQKGLV